AFDDLGRYDAEIVASRERAADVPDLDSALPGQRNGQPVNLRWVYTHLVEEYARHMGHADLVRESIDGATGY
ncbi:MAG: DinB family protein, partial [Actinomycetota bacterium]|nr:DinB family protein [Actinomycetota bacterium]